MEGEVLEDDRRPATVGGLDEPLRQHVESLTDAIPLPPSLPVQKGAHDPPVPRLLPPELPPPPEVRFLDSPNAVERKGRREYPLAGSHDSVQRILVRIEGDCAFGFVRPRGVLTDDEDNLARYHSEGTEAPRRVLQE